MKLLHPEMTKDENLVARFRQRGAIFVETVTEVPHGAVLIFSAHGVAPSEWAPSPTFSSRATSFSPSITKTRLTP